MTLALAAFLCAPAVADDIGSLSSSGPIRPSHVSTEDWEKILRQIERSGLKSFPATSEYKKILPSSAGGSFGWSTAADGDTIVVGAYRYSSNTGAAYVFERNQGGADNWGEVKKLLASDSATYRYYGRSVAISGDTVVVIGDASTGKGAAYIYERNQGGANNWGEVAKVSGSDQGAGVSMSSVGISNDFVIAGAISQSASAGAAYLFERNQGGADNWGQVAKLTGTGTPPMQFGSGVAISGETVVVGALTENSAYIFERNQGGADSWGEVAEITASDAVGGEQFGNSVGISGDTVVVGAEWADTGGENRGAAYVFERNQGGADNWGEVAILAAEDAVDQNHLGVRVAIDGDAIAAAATVLDDQGVVYLFDRNEGGADNWGQVAKLAAADGAELEFGVAVSGSTLALGAAGSGAAYVFRRSGDTWLQAQKTDADDTAGWNWFGFSLGMDGDVAVVGAWRADMDTGSAYVFERNQGGIDNWGQVAKLTASDGAMYERFGESVDISDDHVVVGAPAHGSGQTYYMAGAAYVFSRNQGGADNWGEVAKLMAPDATTYDQFGWSVAIDHDLVVVGANKGDGAVAGSGTTPGSGSAYLFARNQGGADSWGSVTELNAADGAASDFFGESVAVDGNWVAVGAIGDEGSTGAVYLYGRNQGGADAWGQTVKITASDGQEGDRFGTSVALHGDTALVGAPNGDAAYVYLRNLGGVENWGEAAILTASDGQAFDNFGYAVSLTAGLAAVGATQGDGAVEDSGAVYLYQRNIGGADSWGELIKLEASDGAESDEFGHAVAISGHRLWCGAPFDDDVSSGSGAAYRFDIRAAVLEADLSITMDDGESSVVPGETTTYAIVVGNAGPASISGASVTDDFPETLDCSWTCVATGEASCTAGPESGDISDSVDLPVDETVTYTAVCSISSSATGTVSNTASVAPPGGYEDTNSTNDSETDENTLAPAADLSITVDSVGSTAVLGAEVTYRIVVSNSGPSAVPGAAVTDTFPSDLTGVTWTCSSAGGGSCAASGSGDISESVDLPVGASVTFIATGTCDSGASGPTLDNTANVACPVSVVELEPSDNTATESDQIGPAEIFSDGFESGDTLEWN